MVCLSIATVTSAEELILVGLVRTSLQIFEVPNASLWHTELHPNGSGDVIHLAVIHARYLIQIVTL